MFNPLIKNLKGLLKLRIQSQDAAPNSQPTDTYSQKLLNYIPADIIAAWAALTGILSQAATKVPSWLSWVVFGSLLVLTPLYVCFIKTSPSGFTWSKTFNWVTALLSFTVWAFAMGGPFATLSWYQPVFGSVLLVIFTLTIPVLEGFFVKTPPSTGGNGSGTGGSGAGGSNAKPSP